MCIWDRGVNNVKRIHGGVHVDAFGHESRLGTAPTTGVVGVSEVGQGGKGGKGGEKRCARPKFAHSSFAIGFCKNRVA